MSKGSGWDVVILLTPLVIVMCFVSLYAESASSYNVVASNDKIQIVEVVDGFGFKYQMVNIRYEDGWTGWISSDGTPISGKSMAKASQAIKEHQKERQIEVKQAELD